MQTQMSYGVWPALLMAEISRLRSYLAPLGMTKGSAQACPWRERCNAFNFRLAVVERPSSPLPGRVRAGASQPGVQHSLKLRQRALHDLVALRPARLADVAGPAVPRRRVRLHQDVRPVRRQRGPGRPVRHAVRVHALRREAPDRRRFKWAAVAPTVV